MRTSDSTPIWCRILWYFATLVAVFVGVGCDSGSDIKPIGVSTSGGGVSTSPDVGFVGDTGPEDQPLRQFCSPHERRCLFENSPLFQECDATGHQFEVGACAAGQMCHNGRCVGFACSPGRDICVGTQTRATCAEDGHSVRDQRRCPGDGDVCRGGECIDSCEAAARAHSYLGCEYLARELPNLYRYGGEVDKDAPFGVVVANPSPLLDTKVTIRLPDGQPAPLLGEVDVDPGSYAHLAPPPVRSAILTHDASTPIDSPAQDVAVPPQAAAVFLLDPGASYTMRSYRVTSTRPIVAYQFSPYCCNVTASNDASLLLPTTTLSTRYRVLSYPSMLDPANHASFPGTLTIVADKDDTHVHVDSPVDLLQSADWFPTEPYDGSPLTLDAGESITLGTATKFLDGATTDRDLSGAVITADKNIAVFAGHLCTFVPQDQWACDHLEEQMFPASTLGKSYLLTPLRQRGPGGANDKEEVYWRVVADEASDITFSPPLDQLPAVAPSNDVTPSCMSLVDGGVVHLEAGELCEFGVLQPVAVQSTGALLVGGVLSGHFSTGQYFYGAHAGDPSLFLAPPVEQFRKNYSFVSPPTFAKNYVAVAVPASGAVALDGVAIAPEGRLELRQVDLGGRTWDIYNVAVESGYHTMTSSERFGIVVYAYDDFVSYAFPGGLDLLPKGSR